MAQAINFGAKAEREQRAALARRRERDGAQEAE